MTKTNVVMAKCIDYVYEIRRFAEGNHEERMNIIKFLGSNFVLKGQKLYIDLRKPFFVFKNNRDAIFDLDNKVELANVAVVNGNNEGSKTEIPIWWTIVEEVWNFNNVLFLN